MKKEKMMMKRKNRWPAAAVFILLGCWMQTVWGTPFKTLVVMSYEENYRWCQDIRTGIESVLKNSGDIRYFYLNTKSDPGGGPEKAKEAFALYETYQPDGVITADDSTQSMFAVPYLKDKVKTPVMFCGVNAPPENYGYPAENVSGILERETIRQTLSFVKLLLPDIKTFGCIQKDGVSADAVLEQIQAESKTYPLRFVDFKMPKSQKEAEASARELSDTCDVLFTSTMRGIAGDDGRPLSDREAIPVVTGAFGKPVVGSNAYNVPYGLLGAVVKTGQEQGEAAAKMLLKAMKGTPVSELKITQNQFGKRILNLTVIKKMGIKMRSDVLLSSELVKMEE